MKYVTATPCSFDYSSMFLHRLLGHHFRISSLDMGMRVKLMRLTRNTKMNRARRSSLRSQDQVRTKMPAFCLVYPEPEVHKHSGSVDRCPRCIIVEKCMSEAGHVH